MHRHTYDGCMPKATLLVADSGAPPDRPAYQPFPEMAQALRSQSDRILDEWRGRTLFSMPELGELPVKEFMNSVARILAAMADALESNEPPDLQRLMQAAPAHGFQRFLHDYDLSELFAEERVLRRAIVSRVEEALARRCGVDESAALHSMIDIMLQQGVLALVQEQKLGLRQGAEAQLKHLSFLSHDLCNTFLVMTCNLEVIKHELSKLPHMSEAAKRVTASLAIIRRTRNGMFRLLEHEGLRHAHAKPRVATVRLLDIVEPIVTMEMTDVSGSRPRIEIEIDAGAAVSTNADLLTIILQNLIGNAVKHGSVAAAARPISGGVDVRVEAERSQGPAAEHWRVSVVDHGPGIPEDQIETLFNAFERLPQRGEGSFAENGGFGLGLAIASQAARLLGTKLEVKTEVGRGSTFSVRLPVADGA